MKVKDFYDRLSFDKSLEKRLNFNPYYCSIESGLTDPIVINGKEYIDLASNNYLGLAADERVKGASIETIEKYGTSMCGTPIATGYAEIFKQLEERMARFTGLEAAIIFPSGYQANCALIPAIASQEDLLIVDHYAHASLVHGIKAGEYKVRPFLQVIDKRSEIWVNSTGDGMELERMSELKESGLTAVMFSLHSPYPDKINKFMKSEKAWDALVNGVEMCHKTDIPVAFNMCLQVESFYSGDYEKLMKRAKEFNASIVQLIKPKTSGGWLGADIKEFTKRDLLHVKELVLKYNGHKDYRDYPSISAQIIEEDKSVFGCTAGGTDRFYINAKGDVQPCEFLNISFGNIAKDDFDLIYKRMRGCFENPGECWLCEKYSGEISRLRDQEGIQILPLNEELSKKIYLDWDRGEPTELYQRIERVLR